MRTNTIFLSIFGVVLPIAALLVELFSGMCASAIFNPIPSVIDTILVASVPAGNLFLLIRTRSHEFKPSNLDFLICGVVLAVSAFYTVMFAPFVPAAFLFIIWFGLGLLPLAPLASFLTALILLRRLLAKRKETE